MSLDQAKNKIGRLNMNRLAVIALMAALTPSQAFAAEITVLTSGVTASALRAVAANWMTATSNTVIFKTGTVGGTVTNVGSVPADLVLLPPDAMAQVTAKLKADTLTPVVSAKYGLAVKKGAPHPDISTVAKFAAVLKASSGIQFNDPASGSASGAAVAEMLKRPEFAGVIARPMREMPGAAVAKGDADFAGGTLSEELPIAGAEIAGPFPDSLGMHLDFSGAILADAPQPAAATAFLSYLKTSAAAPVWQANGFVAP
jgi:molybdate transport system substrate-binding protein